MQADQLDLCAVDVVMLEELVDGRAEGVGHILLQSGQGVRHRAAGVLQKIQQTVPQGFGIGDCGPEACFDKGLAIGAQQGNIDAIHRRAADGADDGSDLAAEHACYPSLSCPL